MDRIAMPVGVRRRRSVTPGVPALAALLLLAGCASAPDPVMDLPDGARDCPAFFQAFDTAVRETGSPNARFHRVEGYPHLRTTRFLDSVRTREAAASARARELWLRAMLAAGREAREIEWSTLPVSERERLGAELPRKLDRCAERLAEADLGSEARMNALMEQAGAEDDYSTLARTFGLYPLTRWGIRFGVHRWQAGARERCTVAPPEDAAGWTWYLPEEPFRDRRREARGLLAEAPRDRLGRPRLSDRAWARLEQAYAPIWVVEEEGPYDRIGQPVWPGPDADSPRLRQVDGPPVYVHRDFTRLEDGVVVQLIYGVWFPERPRAHAFDLLGGHLSGVLYRVTLDGSGEIVLHDTVHHCGCYHQFHPGPGWQPRPSPDFAEPPLVLPSPRIGPGERVAIGLRSGSHYVEHLFSAGALPEPEVEQHTTRQRAYAELERVSVEGVESPERQTRRSLFDADGLVPGTERRERWVLWPAGVPEAGSKRQYGRHLTAFVGRRFFDDPYLMERVLERADP